MNIFLAGSTGLVGRLLLMKLLDSGHQVTAMTRNSDNRRMLQSLGVQVAVMDAFDRQAIMATFMETRPEVVIHQLTSLREHDLRENARLRMDGTRNLVDASLQFGVKRIIAQSISWAYAPGDDPASEAVPLDVDAVGPRKTTIAGVVALEHAVAEVAQHVILRYGTFYGPGTWYDRNGVMTKAIGSGQIAATNGVTSFVHIQDAANAALLAMDWPSGPVNIVDNEPAPGIDWIPVYAAAIGASVPHIQHEGNSWERGASNAKAREIYGWDPIYPTWRTGFSQTLGVHRPSR